MHILMPWFLPVATGIGFVCSRTAVDLIHRERNKKLDGLLMFVLAWSPLLTWILAQFTSAASRNP